jgi:transcriptional regulator with XRE-family HTH domain
MAVSELGVALTVLRVVRGWNQDDLAKASGLGNSAVSDYERGRKVPELKTLERLVAAMGYPLAAIDHARRFIEALRSGSALFDPMFPRRQAPGDAAGTEQPVAPGGPAALQWEVEQVSAEVGRAVSRMTRVMFELIGQSRGVSPAAEPQRRSRH